MLGDLLAVWAGCFAYDRLMLILAAMARDSGHQGVRARLKSATNEAMAACKACQLFFRDGAQGAAHRKFTALILATEPNAEFITGKQASPTPQPCHDLAILLREADLFTSHSYGWKMQYWLAAKVKFELRSTSQSLLS